MFFKILPPFPLTFQLQKGEKEMKKLYLNAFVLGIY